MLLGPVNLITDSQGALFLGPLAISTSNDGNLILGPVTINASTGFINPITISVNTSRIGDYNRIVVTGVNLLNAAVVSVSIWQTLDNVYTAPANTINIVSATELDVCFPVDGIPLGGTCYISVTANDEESDPFSFVMGSHYAASGSFVTLNVDYNNLHPDSPFADPAYENLISVGTQIDYSGVTSPNSFAVNISQNGLVSITGASASNFDQQVFFALVQPIERGYQRSTEGYWVFDTPTPNTINAWLEDATMVASGYAGSAVTNSGVFNGVLGDVSLSASGTVVEVGTINGFLTTTLDNFTSVITGNLESATGRITAILDNITSLATGVVAATGAIPIRFRLKYTKIIEL